MPAYEYDSYLDEIPHTEISEGSLCKECCNNDLCKDILCVLYEYRSK